MIKLPEHEDDIYINAMVQICSSTRDKELAFDLDAYRKLSRALSIEVDNRLGELFSGDVTDLDNRTDLAEIIFIRGWACERGFNCEQDFDQAATKYAQASKLGVIEAEFRLAWLIEHDLISQKGIDPKEEAYRLYEGAADKGHIKSMIACGQHILFEAQTIDDLLIAQGFFQKANLLAPNDDYLYVDAITDIIKDAEGKKIWKTANHLEYILPIIGHLKKGESAHYQRGIESNLRLAFYLHANEKRTGTFFLSWCYLNGLGLPKDRNMGMRLAFRFCSDMSRISNYYMAWVYLSSGIEGQVIIGLQFLKLSAKAGLPDAENDWTKLTGMNIVDLNKLVDFLKSSHKLMNLESWFGF